MPLRRCRSAMTFAFVDPEMGRLLPSDVVENCLRSIPEVSFELAGDIGRVFDCEFAVCHIRCESCGLLFDAHLTWSVCVCVSNGNSPTSVEFDRRKLEKTHSDHPSSIPCCLRPSGGKVV